MEGGTLDISTPQGTATINAMVNRQAAQLAHLQDFRPMMWITLASIPLLVLLKEPVRHQGEKMAAAAIE